MSRESMVFPFGWERRSTGKGEVLGPSSGHRVHNRKHPCVVCANRAVDLSRYTKGGESMVDVLLKTGRNVVLSPQGHALCQTCIRRLEREGAIDLGGGWAIQCDRGDDDAEDLDSQT